MNKAINDNFLLFKQPFIRNQDLISWLYNLGTSVVVVALVGVWGKNELTGNLEEKGKWLESFWQDIVEKVPQANAGRLLWNTAFFVFPTEDILQIEEFCKQVIDANKNSSLEIYCVLSLLSGSTEKKLKDIDEMQSVIANKINFTNYKSCSVKLLNGINVDNLNC